MRSISCRPHPFPQDCPGTHLMVSRLLYSSCASLPDEPMTIYRQPSVLTTYATDSLVLKLRRKPGIKVNNHFTGLRRVLGIWCWPQILIDQLPAKGDVMNITLPPPFPISLLRSVVTLVAQGIHNIRSRQHTPLTSGSS